MQSDKILWFQKIISRSHQSFFFLLPDEYNCLWEGITKCNTPLIPSTWKHKCCVWMLHSQIWQGWSHGDCISLQCCTQQLFSVCLSCSPMHTLSAKPPCISIRFWALLNEVCLKDFLILLQKLTQLIWNTYPRLCFYAFCFCFVFFFSFPFLERNGHVQFLQEEWKVLNLRVCSSKNSIYSCVGQ